MTTEFVGFLPPPGDSIAQYDRKAHFDGQPDSVPDKFREAMSVREEVFVNEQGVPLENELDEDDARSFHWITYASVGTSHTSPPVSPTKQHRGGESHSRRASKDEERRGSTANRVAVGTIRLVPPPHPHHHAPDGLESSRRTYVKLGRLATLPPYRKLGLSKLLINSALEWARENPREIVKPVAPAEAEIAKLEGKEVQEPWNGWVLVHAQTEVEGLWTKYGFERDLQMGTWDEEGIEHIGMWKLLDHVKGTPDHFTLH
jgi:predicted GNAT family N-acyltransferase